MTVWNTNMDASLAPACGPTMELVQRILDGELPAAALNADPHPALCDACRERIAIARLMQKTLMAPSSPCVPSGLTESILSAAREDRLARIRRRLLHNRGWHGGRARGIRLPVRLVDQPVK